MVGSAVGAIGSIGGALISSGASSKASSQQQAGLSSAAAAQQQGYQEAQNYLNPYYQSGLQDQSLYNSILTGTPISQQPGFQQAFGGGANAGASQYLPQNVTTALESVRSSHPEYQGIDGTPQYVNIAAQNAASMTPEQYAAWSANSHIPGLQGTPQSVFTDALGKVNNPTPPTLSGDFALANQTGSGGSNGGQYAAFFNSPDYQFSLQQGLQAVNNSASAKGQLNSGAQQIGLTQYAQGLASQQYNSFMSKLAGQATAGQQAGGALANAALGQGSALAGIAGQQGNVAAAGTTGSANALTSGLNGLVGSSGIGAAGGSGGVLGSALSGLFGSGGSNAAYSSDSNASGLWT